MAVWIVEEIRDQVAMPDGGCNRDYTMYQSSYSSTATWSVNMLLPILCSEHIIEKYACVIFQAIR